MKNFYLIDQSLKGPGGHHFDYSMQIAQVAMDSGCAVTLGTHQKFSHPDLFSGANVQSVFRYTTYAESSKMVGIQDMVGRRKSTGLFKRRPTDDADLRSRQFTNDCVQFFQKPFQLGDSVFFTTLSDLEVSGLMAFFQQRPDAALANWHLQFHFPLFQGRPSEYASQNHRLEKIKPVFDRLQHWQKSVPIHLYVTSKPLQVQYQKLGLEISDLPYPINPEFFQPIRKPKSDGLIRVTFAGGTRAEKGGIGVGELTNKLRDVLTLQQARLVIQKKKRNWIQKIGDWFRGRGDAHLKSAIHSGHLETVSFPLSADQYRDFICSAGIGLLTTYDSRAYAARRAGIMGEYLAAGVPVIVPAGCWLADQIEAPQQEYLANLFADQVDRLKPRDSSLRSEGQLQARFELPAESVSQSGPPEPQSTSHHIHAQHSDLSDSEASNTNPNQPGHRLFVLGFRPERPRIKGSYFSVDIQFDSQNKSCQRVIVGKNHSEPLTYVAFSVPPTATSATLRIGNAYPEKMSVKELQIGELNATIIDSAKPLPRSCVGLVAADAGQSAELIREMIENYTHYRKSAEEFSLHWFRNHDPRATLNTLLECENNVATSMRQTA